MKVFSALTALLAAVALPLTSAQNTTPLSIDGRFQFGESGVLTISRMDPIVAPGSIAGHVHQVIGGSGFRSK
jgi:hypothetical protein